MVAKSLETLGFKAGIFLRGEIFRKTLLHYKDMHLIASYKGDSNRNPKKDNEQLLSNERAMKWQIIIGVI